MNELFTLLIILAAIISFLNKIFGQKKNQPTSAPSQLPGQKPREWIPPWLEPDDLGTLEVEEEEAWSQKAMAAPVTSEVTKPLIAPQEFSRPAATLESYSTRSIPGLELDLSSSDALKKGIILAEILGICKGRKNLITA